MLENNIIKIIDEKTERLTSVPDKLVSGVGKSQLEAYKEIESLVYELESESGSLLLSEANLSKISSIDKLLNDTIFNDEYKGYLTDYIGQFKAQADLSNKYFTELNVGFSDIDPINTIITSQKNAISLLGDDAFTQAFSAPLKDMLVSSITGGASLKDTISTLRDFALGTDQTEGRMVSYVKTIAYDSFAVSDRTYTTTVSNQLGLEFYLYFGGHISDTREFCDERRGKYFHKKEIEGWGNGDRCCGLSYPQSGVWPGRNKLTNKTTIFTLAGGYNCKHSINPVSIKSVPKTVIERNVSNGNYKS